MLFVQLSLLVRKLHYCQVLSLFTVIPGIWNSAEHVLDPQYILVP